MLVQVWKGKEKVLGEAEPSDNILLRVGGRLGVKEKLFSTSDVQKN